MPTREGLRPAARLVAVLYFRGSHHFSPVKPGWDLRPSPLEREADRRFAGGRLESGGGWNPEAGMTNRRQATGRRGEALAAEHLRGLGYEILRTNVRTRYGELDIIAREGDALVFVEVRTRHGGALGSPEESVDLRKRRRLAELAEAYLQTLPEPPPTCRIDVVVVEIGPGERVRRVELIRDAV